MRRQYLVFFLTLFVLLVYTAEKAMEVFPSHMLAAALATVALFVVMFGGQFVYRSDPTIFRRAWFPAVAWTSSLTMGFWATLLLFSIPLDVVQILYGWIAPHFHASGELLPDSVRQGVFYFAAAAAVVGLLQVLRGPQVKEVPVTVPNLPPALRGLRIAQLSDLHVGPTIQRRYVEKVVRRVNELRADLVVLTGDIADAKLESIHDHLRPLGSLRSRLGVFYATGNHEYYWGVAGILERFRELGVQPLLNEHRPLGDGLVVAGVTDPMGGMVPGHGPSVKQAATDMPPGFRLLLAHRPDVCLEAEELGFDLQLSGHTHAGQFFPFSLIVPFAHKYWRGLNRHGRMWVYVNPGTGYWGPPNRFAVASEITLLELKG